MSKQTQSQRALRYHEGPTPGKIVVEPSKSCSTQEDLSLAYSPGVAAPSLAIHKNPAASFRYTNRANLVAVISNGTAVLGLGDIGAAASKPVMEGKSVLFKRFAGIDAFDIELDEHDPEKLVHMIAAMEPTFGGVNLEDIKAPECFYIEDELRKRMNIPVFHDDQHGTAIISAAALLNALEVAGKSIEEVRIVVNGAGAAGIRCAQQYVRLGAKKRNIFMLDSTGIITKDRKNLTPQKKQFARSTELRTLAEALNGADVFLGLSVGKVMTPTMLKSMAAHPIVFALANPVPEMDFDLARSTRDDVIMATGRSDFPNQINNVLGFPFVFRGALDVHAETITDNMKVAATRALADLTKERVPARVKNVYGRTFRFGPDYIVPTPFDPRLVVDISLAVAKQAITDGVARKKLSMKRYEADLQAIQRKILKQYA